MLPPVNDEAQDQPRVLSAAERLVAELRDECSEVGVSARGMNLPGLDAAVRAFAREARRYGALCERVLVLLKECLRDERLSQSDRDKYDAALELCVKAAIDEYYGGEGLAARG
ncbi:MAG: hypothetical protein WKG32_09995 [Gemmatimonadaceae bacterium]